MNIHAAEPENLRLRAGDRERIVQALLRLPVELPELLRRAQLDKWSYKETAPIAGIAIGTVMSRLSRARAQLRHQLEAMESE